jgi:hypothetical protein
LVLRQKALSVVPWEKGQKKKTGVGKRGQKKKKKKKKTPIVSAPRSSRFFRVSLVFFPLEQRVQVEK